MNTIVMNTMTGAVTEYTNHDFDSITPTHAGSALGLYAFGGNLDVATPIISNVVTSKTHQGDTRKKHVDIVFFAVKGSGNARMTVYGETAAHGYNFTIEQGGESRSKPGRGIRENYLAFGFSNLDGQDFQLDRIEANIGQSVTRRT